MNDAGKRCCFVNISAIKAVAGFANEIGKGNPAATLSYERVCQGNKLRALIIAAHGSRKRQSNEEVADLAKRIAVKIKDQFDTVDHAFLQFAHPSLEHKIQRLIQNGVKNIVVFPFFTGSGSHILVDIPQLVEQKKNEYNNVDIRICRHLGKLFAIEDIIVDEVTSQSR